jgi:hypothetical protein
MQDNSTLSQNIPNDSLMYQTFTPTFGNMNFVVQPSMTGEVSNTFGIIPYMSLESLIYAQQTNAQASPINLLSGQNSGQQNIQGQYTITDANGLPRMVMGYSPGAF